MEQFLSRYKGSQEWSDAALRTLKIEMLIDVTYSSMRALTAINPSFCDTKLHMQATLFAFRTVNFKKQLLLKIL